jgi:hypothetical protein
MAEREKERREKREERRMRRGKGKVERLQCLPRGIER